jgi:1-phosphofructokinase family hexose kinase
LIKCMVLNPVLEVLYEMTELRPGGTALDTISATYPAGKGLNVARAIKILGEEPCVVGPMPRDSLSQFERCCEHLKIGHAFYPVEGAVRVNTTILEKGLNQTTHINSRGQELSPRVQEEMLRFMQEHFDEDDTWVFSGSVPLGFPDNTYRKFIEACKVKGFTTILDTRNRALKLGLRAKPDMVKPNFSELQDFFEEEIRGVHHIALKGKRLIDMGIRHVFISLGADGMIALHENDCLLCSVPAVKAVDTVGCGDAMVAGLAVARERRFSFSEMCRLAVACGASNALHLGPGAIERDEVWQLMEDVRVEAV